MTQNSSPNEQQENATTVANNAAPFYMRPWFWGIIFFILLLLAAAIYAWKQWSLYERELQAEHALLQKRQDDNSTLLAEKDRLLQLLAMDPCELKELLKSENNLLAPEPPILSPASPNNSANPKAEALPPPLSSASPQQTSPQEEQSIPSGSQVSFAKQLEQSTVFIIAENNKNIITGTGFFIAPGIILTNAHVLGATPTAIYVAGKFKEGVVEATAKVISREKSRDYAVLQVPVQNNSFLTFTTAVTRTQKISAWGFPGAISQHDPKYKALFAGQSHSMPEVVYTEGSVSVIQETKPPHIVHSAVVSQGNSGGPLVNQQGEVVGINTYISLDKESYRQSNIALVSKDIVAFLQSHNIPYTLASPSKSAKESKE